MNFPKVGRGINKLKIVWGAVGSERKKGGQDTAPTGHSGGSNCFVLAAGCPRGGYSVGRGRNQVLTSGGGQDFVIAARKDEDQVQASCNHSDAVLTDCRLPTEGQLGTPAEVQPSS